MPGQAQRPYDSSHGPGEEEVGCAVLADHHVVQAMGAGNLFDLAEAPGGELHGIAGFFESPDDRREEVSVGRVIQVNPDAHIASREHHNPTGMTKLLLWGSKRARARSIQACPQRM